MRVLVVGGTGFVGAHVVGQLVAGGHEVAVFGRGLTEADPPPGVIYIRGDRRRLADFADEIGRLAPRVVVDLCAHTEADVRAVAGVCANRADRLVMISCTDVYRAYGLLRGAEPGAPEPVPLAETAPLRQRLYLDRRDPPRHPRDPERWRDDADKIAVERLSLGERFFPGTILRLPPVYGPGDHRHGQARYLRRMADGRPAILLAADTARWRSSRGYVENVAAAIVLAVTDDRAAGRTYNVGEPDALPEADWVRALGLASGWAGDIATVPADALPVHLRDDLHPDQDWVVDSGLIRRELGYREIVPPGEALRRTVAWERAHPATLDPQAFDYAAEDAVLARLARPAG